MTEYILQKGVKSDFSSFVFNKKQEMSSSKLYKRFKTLGLVVSKPTTWLAAKIQKNFSV